MRILVTGGSGYIGSRLMAALAARSDVEEVIDVDLRPPRESGEKIRYVQRDVSRDMRDVFADPARPVDVAMHLAWVLDPLRDAERQREICIGGTQRFLDGCLAGNVRHVFFMSSGTANGANPAHARPVSEDAPLRDEFHFQYSAEKREAEELCRRFAADRPGTLLQIARPTVVGGPNVSNFIFRSIDKPVVFRALGHDPEIQFVHEDDVAAALVRIVESRAPGAFNIAADGTLRISEAYRLLGARVLPLPLPLLYAIADVAWRNGLTRLVEAPPNFVYFLAYPWLISSRRLKEELGFRFRYTTRETLESFKAARAARKAAAGARAAAGAEAGAAPAGATSSPRA